MEVIFVVGNRWIVVDERKPEARYRLFCFPYAGGASSIYNKWNKYLPSDIELFSIELPGRGRRLSEPPIRHMSLLICSMMRDLLPYLKEKPFIFFGYSMGSLISYELTKALLNSEGIHPEILFAAAHRAPHINRISNQVYKQSDEELIKKLKELNGTPEIILNTPELLELILPVMRADLELCDYEYNNDHIPLNLPITAFAGDSDKNVPVDFIRAWEEHTTEQFGFQVLKGDHFFIREQEEKIVQTIIKQTIGHNFTKIY